MAEHRRAAITSAIHAAGVRVLLDASPLCQDCADWAKAIKPPLSLPWFQAASGRAVPLLSPTAADIDWADIALSLGRQCRFNGHVPAGFYSIAQHCHETARVVVAALTSDSVAADLALIASRRRPDGAALVAVALRGDGLDPDLVRAAALLHDAHEAYLGDITTPVAAALAIATARRRRWAETGFAVALDRLKATFDAAIYAAADLPWPPPEGLAALVDAADQMTLATERRDLLAPPPHRWPGPEIPAAPWRIKPRPGDAAGTTWLSHLRATLTTRAAISAAKG